MIRPASIGNLAAPVSLCAVVDAVPLDSLEADARRLLAPPRLHLVLAGIAMGGLATRIDDRLEWELPGGGVSGAAFDLAEYYGSTGKTAAAGAVLWTLARWREADRLRTRSEEVLRSVAAAALIVAPLKLATRRRRPDGGGRLSFPSGHTATAFVLSSVLARRHGLRIGLPAYGLAVLVPVERVGEKNTTFPTRWQGPASARRQGGRSESATAIRLCRLDSVRRDCGPTGHSEHRAGDSPINHRRAGPF